MIPARDILLAKTGARRSQADNPPGNGGPDAAAAFILKSSRELADVARRHKMGMLVRLLEMTQMEAEEQLRLRHKGNLP
jgi:hypothetical protein